jgi:GNAT superfamily N-acetyltransferase
MTTLRIRTAEKKDLEKILELYNGLTDDPDDKISLREAAEKFEKLKTYPDYKLYVAEYKDEIAGTFAVLIMDNLAHRGEPSSIVEDVVIRTDLQGMGIGTGMMNFAMEISREKGCYKMVLSSHLRRENAHRFYETLGFKKHGYSFVVDLKRNDTPRNP